MFIKLLLIIIIFVVSYVIGSLNTSLIIGRKMGVDIREHGSQNAGFTNAARVFGPKTSALVLIFDAFKTVTAIVISKTILPNDVLAIYISGVAAVLGHNYPLYFGFKGGKGIVVSTVSLLFANWLIGILVIVFSASIMFFTRYISLGSITGCIILIIISLVFKFKDLKYVMFALTLAGLALYMHKGNIRRLISRTEKKITSN